MKYVTSHRLTGKKPAERKRSQESFANSFPGLQKYANLLGVVEPRSEDGRFLSVLEGEPTDIESVVASLPSDILLEPAMARVPASIIEPVEQEFFLGGEFAPPFGSAVNEAFEVRVSGAESANSDDIPMPEVELSLLLESRVRAGLRTVVSSKTDQEGVGQLYYEPSIWFARKLLVKPQFGFWSWAFDFPVSGTKVVLPPLPTTGPLGWWHYLTGNVGKSRGKGLRIGVVDTGFGPTPNLKHVTDLGSVIDGQHDARSGAGIDCQSHGTHVCGILGARTQPDSGEFEGVAPDADLLSVRVFDSNNRSHQGDVALAVDLLKSEKVDLINLSLGGVLPSAIELEVIQDSLDNGIITFAAAGNGFRKDTLFPAGWAGAVLGVSALGLQTSYPEGSIASQSPPNRIEEYGFGGLYLADFSNQGAGVACASPGVAIISTVPSDAPDRARYRASNGTSMATPISCGTAACILAQDSMYLELERDESRVRRATSLLAQHSIRIGLGPYREGIGLFRAL